MNPKALEKHNKVHPGIMKFRRLQNIDFEIPFMRTPGFHDSQVCEFRFKSRSKTNLETRLNTKKMLTLGTKNSLKKAAQNGSKIN